MRHLFKKINKQKLLSKPALLIFTLFILIAGASATAWMAKIEDTRMRASLLSQTRIAAANINPDQIKALAGASSDLESNDYHELKRYVQNVRSADLQVRFVYLTGRMPDGSIIFHVDSEPVESEEYSPPGQLYEESSAEFKQLFEDGKGLVEGPVADRWGTWVSALVPIVDFQTGAVVAVLGMDINARNWTESIVLHSLPAIVIACLLAGWTTFFYLLFHRSEQARVQLARSGVLLAQSEQAYRSVVTNMIDIFFRTDASGVFTMLSPSAASVLGYKDAAALIGNKIDDVFLPCGRQDPLLEQLKISGSVYDLEFKAKCENQTLIDMSISANLVLNAANEPEGFEGIARDIGERKKAQKQQQEVQLLLQHAQKMETVGTLAGGVAHDLNNILSGIVSYPDLVLMQIAEDSPIRESIETIKESGLKAAVIVQDLLTLARRGVSSQQLVNLNDLIAAHLKSPEFSKMLSFHPNITVKTELDTNLLPIMGSPVHFAKTLMNLVFNAAESMVGGGQISIGTRNCYLDRPVTGYGSVKEGEYAVLTVADNGVGIAKEDQMRIFEPFYTKKTMGRSGTGLGMAVVWGTVKDHNGYIDLESKQGVGTLFTLYFPITRDLPAADKIESCATADRGSGQTILVVDDIKEQREIASAILTSLNYRVKTFAQEKKP
jgi:PAS domain S-box-containing protein